MLLSIREPYLLTVQKDDFFPNPRREDENFGTMICFHRRYQLGDEHKYFCSDDLLEEMFINAADGGEKGKQMYEAFVNSFDLHPGTSAQLRAYSRALMAEIEWFFNYLISPIKLNVCFTLSFSIISLIVFESNRINKVLKLFLYILILFLALLLGCEYGSYGILLVLLFHLYIRNQHDKTYKIYAITSIILLIIVSMFVFSFSIIHLYSILSLPIILLTPKNIQKIKVNSIKHINYLVYPLHLLIMFLIRFAIVN